MLVVYFLHRPFGSLMSSSQHCSSSNSLLSSSLLPFPSSLFPSKLAPSLPWDVPIESAPQSGPSQATSPPWAITETQQSRKLPSPTAAVPRASSCSCSSLRGYYNRLPSTSTCVVGSRSPSLFSPLSSRSTLPTHVNCLWSSVVELSVIPTSHPSYSYNISLLAAVSPYYLTEDPTTTVLLRSLLPLHTCFT
ncbi:hypothetical protein BDZ45DRAFT_335876 [Acephala macrosclerotiorum]|nr:hypothetical protein BDZ45DRAFT_335876 [Acephala macrosclerotiorum]